MMFVFILFLGLFSLTLMLMSWWRIFEKAGREGWEGIIPVYNLFVLLELFEQPRWWIVFYFIPFVNFLFLVYMNYLLASRFGKDEMFTLGLLVLPMVFYPILAFGDSWWDDDNHNYRYDESPIDDGIV